MCGRVKLDIFESDGVANLCPVSYRTINQYGDTTTITQICRHYRMLYGACSEHILLQRSPGYYSESGSQRMHVDRRIRFEYAMCGQGNFSNRKEKVADSKLCGYMWMGPDLLDIDFIYKIPLLA